MPSINMTVAACALAAWTALFTPVAAQQAPAASVVVLPFAVAGHGDPSPACLPVQDAAALDAAARSDLPLQVSEAVAGQLGGRPGLRVYGRAEDAPASALIVTGCIQRAEAGNAAGRLIGMNMGASALSAHVQLYRGGQLVRKFDAEAIGANKLPPIGPVGLAIHGVRGLHETLHADAAKLAKLIAVQVVAG